jgi:hypothetical protein
MIAIFADALTIETVLWKIEKTNYNIILDFACFP